MRRKLLYLSLSLLTFTVGFLLSATSQNLLDGLALALPVLGLLAAISCIGLSLHYIKVAVLTLLIWIPFAAFVINFAFPSSMCCVIYPPQATRTSGMMPRQ